MSYQSEADEQWIPSDVKESWREQRIEERWQRLERMLSDAPAPVCELSLRVESYEPAHGGFRSESDYNSYIWGGYDSRYD
jgi:hypothetical protein